MLQNIQVQVTDCSSSSLIKAVKTTWLLHVGDEDASHEDDAADQESCSTVKM